MHHELARRTRLACTGWIAGRLFDTGSYPAAIPAASPSERVHGELYEIAPAQAPELLALLDRYEGYLPDTPGRSLFLRQRTLVARKDREPVRAWVYVYNGTTDRLRHITSGDYLERYQGRDSPPPGAPGPPPTSPPRSARS